MTEHPYTMAMTTLQNLAENAADHAGDGWQAMGELSDIYAGCMQHVILLSEDPAYAADFADRVTARRVRLARRTQDAADLDRQLQERRFDKEPASSLARAFEVAAYLLDAATDVQFGSWSVDDSSVACMFVGGTDDATARAWTRMLADRFDFTYAERPFQSHRFECSATGSVGGIAVKIHDLLDTDPSTLPAAAGVRTGTSASLDERVRKNLARAAELQSLAPVKSVQISAYSISAWAMHTDLVAARAGILRIADDNGFTYAEEPRPNSGPDAVMVSASTEINGLTVDFWDICHEPAAAEVEAEGLMDWERELLGSATDPTPESVAEAERLAVTFAAEAAAEEQHFAEVDAQFADCAAGDDLAAAAEAGLGVDL